MRLVLLAIEVWETEKTFWYRALQVVVAVTAVSLCESTVDKVTAILVSSSPETRTVHVIGISCSPMEHGLHFIPLAR